MGFWDTLMALFVRDTVKSVSKAKKQQIQTEQLRFDRKLENDAKYYELSESCRKQNGYIIDAFMELRECIIFECADEDSAVNFHNTSVMNDNGAFFVKALSAYPYYRYFSDNLPVFDQKTFVSEMRKTELSFSGAEILGASTTRNGECQLSMVFIVSLTRDIIGDFWSVLFSMPLKNQAKKDRLLKLMKDKIIQCIRAFNEIGNIQLTTKNSVETICDDIQCSFELAHVSADIEDYNANCRSLQDHINAIKETYPTEQ